MNSAFCSSVVSYRREFIAHKSVFPIKGIYLIQESCHNGGVLAFAISLPRKVDVGTLISEDSAVMVSGQSIDQSTVSGGRDLRSWRF